MPDSLRRQLAEDAAEKARDSLPRAALVVATPFAFMMLAALSAA